MSAGEIIIILFVYLMFFGAKGVPALAQTLGKAVYQFRNAARDVQNEIMSSANEIKREANIKMDQMEINLDEEHPHQQKAPNIPQRKIFTPPTETTAVEPSTEGATPSSDEQPVK
ncbi:MAG: twin-arginine translocase TatA/TatE family subunit [Flavobacteriales bacterium]